MALQARMLSFCTNWGVTVKHVAEGPRRANSRPGTGFVVFSKQVILRLVRRPSEPNKGKVRVFFAVRQELVDLPFGHSIIQLKDTPTREH